MPDVDKTYKRRKQAKTSYKLLQDNISDVGALASAMDSQLDSNITIAPATLIEYASALYQVTSQDETTSAAQQSSVVSILKLTNYPLKTFSKTLFGGVCG